MTTVPQLQWNGGLRSGRNCLLAERRVILSVAKDDP